jgi:hypothetical protein
VSEMLEQMEWFARDVMTPFQGGRSEAAHAAPREGAP